MSLRILAPAALAAASALVLAGCAGGDEPSATDDGTVTVVASTNVYGDIAEAIGGDLVSVTSIIDSLAQDPHSYEASARDQLTVSRADLLLENGGGYDAFMDTLIDATGTDAPVLTGVEFSSHWTGEAAHDDSDDHDGHDHDHVEGFNEHVWYDVTAVSDIAAGIESKLSSIDPAHEAEFAANLATFRAGIDDLESSLDDISAAHSGEQVFVTEPVPLYLTDAAGLENATPAAFSEAVEEGQDVPPATLLEANRVIASGDVRLLIVNAQTGGAETTEVTDKAKAAGIPVLEFTELVPADDTYLTWMQSNVAALADTLSR